MRQPLNSTISRLAGFLAVVFVAVFSHANSIQGQSVTSTDRPEPNGRNVVPSRPFYSPPQRRLEQQTLDDAGLQVINTPVSAFAAEPDQASWRQASGPETGNVFTVLKKDARLFIGTGSGIYTSDDNGEHWQPVNNNLHNQFVYSLARVGTTLFAGTSNRVWRSTDEGATWTFSSSGLPTGQCFKVLVQGSNLYAAIMGRGVYRSTNNGDTWTLANPGLPTPPNLANNGHPLTFAATDNALFIRLLASDLSGTSLYRLTDVNGTWSRVNLNLPAGEYPQALAATATRVFVGTVNGNLYASDNNGDTWIKLASELQKDLSILSNFFIVTAGNTVYLQLKNSTYVSTDNGVTFTKKSDVSTLNHQSYGLAVEDGTLFVYSDDGVTVSKDNGATWARKDTGLRAGAIYGIGTAGHRLFVGTQGGGVWLSEDGGLSWTQRNNGLTDHGAAYVNSWMVKGNVLYISTVRGAYRSNDWGGQWTALNNGLREFVNLYGLMSIGSKLYAGSYGGGAYVSSDDGQSWQAVAGLSPDQPVLGFASFGSSIFAGSNGGGVFRSTDNGATWTAINTGLSRQPDRFINGLSVVENGILALTDGGIFRSTDGTSWTVALNNVSVSALARAGRKLFVSTYGAGVYVSSDNGSTWAAANQGLSRLNLSTVAVSGSGLWAGSEGEGAFVLSDVIATNTTVSAASFAREAVAPNAIVAAFGQELATGTEIATSQPLPTELRGTNVSVLDNAGVERRAPLYFVSTGQINFQMPSGTAAGLATVTTTNADGVVTIGTTDVKASAPAIFTTNASGTGAAAAVDAITGAAAPFNATQSNGQPNIISVFGTGLGGDATDVEGDVKASVAARIDGNLVTLFYAGRAPGFTGLNQLNIGLPTGIASGTHTLTLSRNGTTSNSVTIVIR